MSSLIARWFVRRAYGYLNRQDLDALMATFAPDGMVSFPGDHELSGEYRGRAQVRAFFARLFDWFPNLRFEARDVAVSGPPWRMRLWVRYHDTASRDGVAWAGWGTQYAQVRWGRLEADYIANDTAAVAGYLDDVRSANRTPRPSPETTPSQ